MRRPWQRSWAVPFTVLALILAVALPLFAASKWSGVYTWPGLIGNFTATVFAFLIALSWDRRARRIEESREADRERSNRARDEAGQLERDRAAAKAELARRRSEAVQRLAPLLYELDENTRSLAALEAVNRRTLALPPIRSGAWKANGAALGALLADYELMSELSMLYDELEDFRWLLRRQAETLHTDDLRELWAEISARVPQLRERAATLHVRVVQQHETPDLDRAAVFERMGFNVVRLNL